jgi:hypothetical protein
MKSNRRAKSWSGAAEKAVSLWKESSYIDKIFGSVVAKMSHLKVVNETLKAPHRRLDKTPLQQGHCKTLCIKVL